MFIRLGDLAIVPCHRTSYDRFNYGKFIVENDKIIDIEGSNVSLASEILMGNMANHPKCDTCSIKKFCLKGCLGAQFEANNEILYPCESVCNLFKAKQKFLKYKYFTELKIFDKAKKIYKDDPAILNYLNTMEKNSEGI